MVTKEINERKQTFKEIFDSDPANIFLDSDYFDLSQQIIVLEHDLKLSQQQAAEIASMSLLNFLSFEMGVLTDKNKYLSIIQKLQLKLVMTVIPSKLKEIVR